MIKLLGTLPRELWVACSGGVDSMAALDFLKNNHDVSVLFVHHGTEASDQGMIRVCSYCDEQGISMVVKYINNTKPKDQSQEEFWRQERYDFFDDLGNDWPVVTAHHLNDCVETYIWSMCHGIAKVIPYRRGRVVRPFLLNTKQELTNWATRKGLKWHDDASNQNTRYTRNLVRHEVMPKILQINPGIEQVVRRIVQDNFDLDKHQY